MIFVDSMDSKRKSRNKREFYKILENPSVPNSIKDKLIDKIDDLL